MKINDKALYTLEICGIDILTDRLKPVDETIGIGKIIDTGILGEATLESEKGVVVGSQCRIVGKLSGSHGKNIRSGYILPSSTA